MSVPSYRKGTRRRDAAEYLAAMPIERFVRALSIPTRTGGDEAPFVDFGEFLAAAFPGVHAALELERVNGHT
ncbi:MAG: hypothetical protein RLZZ275_786, partial [Bacteroidota bacterium]